MYIRMIFSKPMFIMLPTVKIRMITIVGMIPGMVMNRICCTRVAPSITAAS